MKIKILYYTDKDLYSIFYIRDPNRDDLVYIISCAPRSYNKLKRFKLQKFINPKRPIMCNTMIISSLEVLFRYWSLKEIDIDLEVLKKIDKSHNGRLRKEIKNIL